LIEEIERATLMGTVRAPDDYGEWVSGAGAFKRAFLDDIEAAFRCFDTWSACSPKYKGKEATRHKFDQVPADYEGTAIPVTLEMLHWRARRRAEAVIGTLYSPVTQCKKPAAAFQGLVSDLGAGIPRPKGAEPIAPNSLKPEDGIAALDYLRFCWSPKVYQQIVAGQPIPQEALEEARRRSEERREKIDLAGRTLHEWEGKNLAADTAALANDIIKSGAKLYRVDNALVRISAPISDPATAERVRKMHRYKGHPGDVGDPARHAGERLVPILPSDAEALRDIIAGQVATKRRVNRGTKKNPNWYEEIGSFAFKPSAKVHEEPDAGVLKDLGKRALVAQVPEIVGVITAPVMPTLPLSATPEDLLQPGADRIIECSGFDSASGLYLSPVGTIVDVPDAPSADQVKAATNLLRAPWVDFPSAPLAAAMTSSRFKGRLLGANKQIEVSTTAMIIATGNSLNMAGDLSSRFLLVRLNTELERPEDRSVDNFKIRDLRRWVIEHRQQLIAAVHTIVRAYLQECRRCAETPTDVMGRRKVSGTRFGGPCEVLRDAFLWALPELPDPFLSFQASALNSSTKVEATLTLKVLDRIMAQAAGSKCAPPWATRQSFFNEAKSPEQTRWEQKFRARWDRMAPDQRQHCYRTTDFAKAKAQTWECIRGLVKI